MEQFDELLVAARHRRAEFRAVDVKVVEETLEVVLAGRADGRGLDIPEDPGEGLVEIRVLGGSPTDIGEELTGQDVEALVGDGRLTTELRLRVGQVGVVEVGTPVSRSDR